MLQRFSRCRFSSAETSVLGVSGLSVRPIVGTLQEPISACGDRLRCFRSFDATECRQEEHNHKAQYANCFLLAFQNNQQSNFQSRCLIATRAEELRNHLKIAHQREEQQMYSYIKVCIEIPLRILTNEDVSRTLYIWTRTVIPKSGTSRADWVVHSTSLSTHFFFDKLLLAVTNCLSQIT